MTESLFSAEEPLPQRLRPASWEEFVGQEKLTKLLRARPVHSMVLYGPPGTGKTTLAGLLAKESGLVFRALSAVSSGIKDVRDVIEEGKSAFFAGKRVLLFIDEIHRFSKSQQDALLEAVEAGWVVFVGATTENPSFEVIGPLLSRCQVYRLEALSVEALGLILRRALETDPLFAGVELEQEAQAALIESGGGDARKMLRLLEVARRGLPLTGEKRISYNVIRDTLQGAVRRYDKLGEFHYDYASAFIKSLRGSDPDAALLYMAAMLDGGEDPLFIARRMVIFASEDVGNAAPMGLQLAVAAFQALERIGMPEGRIILAQAATFLASAPKSNASYKAVDAALAAVKGREIGVPNFIRNAPTKTHASEGAGQGYRYPHDFPGHFVDAEYRPPGFETVQLYHPAAIGQEIRLLDRLRLLWPRRKYSEEK
ncbi:MAG: replication-associated recombination protein A [Spirochaetia bacterium]|nr:replication-associated recombination protein A [Spirochaetia bacterium]